MNSAPQVTASLAVFLAGLKYEDLPPEVVRQARRGILDWWSNCYGGSDPSLGDATKPGRIAFEVCRQFTGAPQATVFSPGHHRVDVMNAALLNGILSHSLDMDDVHGGGMIHASVTVLPAVLAMGQKLGASGKDLILAYVAGYEAAVRLAETINPASYYYWHTTGVCGTFGAAVGAGKILGLDSGKMQHALGNAGTQAAGLWEFLADGAMSKPLHAGKAASNGLLGALLAGGGFTGASRIIEGDKGFVRAVAKEFDLEKITMGLGRNFKIEQNCFKPYAACRHAHPAVNAVLDLQKGAGFTLDDVAGVTVKTNAVAYEVVANWQPKTPYACKFSLPYCVVASIKSGKLDPGQFAEKTTGDEALRAAMTKVAIEVDPVLDGEFRQDPGKWSAAVLVRTNDGRALLTQVDYPKGDVQNPMSTGELRQKLIDMGSWVMRPGKLEELADRILHIEQYDNINKLMETLDDC